MKKNSCTPINPKKYSCNGLNKINAKNLITKKNSCSSKIPLPPPHNFSNGPSLTWYCTDISTDRSPSFDRLLPLTSITLPYGHGLGVRPIWNYPLTSYQFSTDRRLNSKWISLPWSQGCCLLKWPINLLMGASPLALDKSISFIIRAAKNGIALVWVK